MIIVIPSSNIQSLKNVNMQFHICFQHTLFRTFQRGIQHFPGSTGLEIASSQKLTKTQMEDPI